MDIQVDRQIGGWMNRLTDRQTDRWTYEQTEIRGDGQKNRWRD